MILICKELFDLPVLIYIIGVFYLEEFVIYQAIFFVNGNEDEIVSNIR